MELEAGNLAGAEKQTQVDGSTFDQGPVSDSGEVPFAIENYAYRFAPEYYPKRFNQVSKNDVERTDKQCGGEDVYVKNTKNSEFHATGIVLADNVPLLRKFSNHEGPVDLLSPLAENGGVECVIKKVEVGEIVGWDRFEEQWQFNYTLDLISTGSDQDNSGENQLVSEIIDEQ